MTWPLSLGVNFNWLGNWVCKTLPSFSSGGHGWKFQPSQTYKASQPQGFPVFRQTEIKWLPFPQTLPFMKSDHAISTLIFILPVTNDSTLNFVSLQSNCASHVTIIWFLHAMEFIIIRQHKTMTIRESCIIL